ncbi:hypothetical protein V8E36_004020 [Tilletia maclaganii]
MDPNPVSSLASSSLAIGAVALSVTTSLIATRPGRAVIFGLPAFFYVKLFHDPLPSQSPNSCGDLDSSFEASPPIAVCSTEDPRPVYLSHSPFSRAIKAFGGKSQSQKLAEAGLNQEQDEGSIPWVRICDFAAQADPAFWIVEEELSSWRRLSDDPADRALAALRQAHLIDPSFTPHQPADPIADILELHRRAGILKTTSASVDDNAETIAIHRASLATFVETIDRRPPRGAGAISESWYAARDARFLASGRPQPFVLTPDEILEELREEARVLRAAQQMFYKFVGPILLSLLHFSLAAGFSSPKIMAVLRQTGYLVPYRDVGSVANGAEEPKRKLTPVERAAKQNKRTADRTWSRLLETTQYVLDVAQDVDALLPPSLFNDASVRNGVYAQRGPSSSSSTEAPTNEEDDSHSFYRIGQAQRAYLSRVSGGRGWQSSVRVRLLHANVRHKILSSVKARQAQSATMYDTADEDASKSSSSTAEVASHANLYDEVLNGVPINQEDLLATLASFSSSPLLCIGRMGHYVSAQEREDYVSLWRHVGFYMGCEPDMLRRCFGDARKADGFLFNVVGHLFPNISQSVKQPRHDPANGKGNGHANGAHDKVTPNGDGDGVEIVPMPRDVEEEVQEQDTLASLAILQACADRPPFHTSLQTHWALARHLLGPSLAGYLGIPLTLPLQKVSVDLSFIATRIPILFSTFPLYPSSLRTRWETQRLRLGRIMMRRLINWLYGARLATFTGRAGSGHEVVIELDAGEGKAYARAWRMLMIEMGAVLAGWAVVGLALGVYLLSWASSTFVSRSG